jgi:hypothetical protein
MDDADRNVKIIFGTYKERKIATLNLANYFDIWRRYQTPTWLMDIARNGSPVPATACARRDANRTA